MHLSLCSIESHSLRTACKGVVVFPERLDGSRVLLLFERAPSAIFTQSHDYPTYVTLSSFGKSKVARCTSANQTLTTRTRPPATSPMNKQLCKYRVLQSTALARTVSTFHPYTPLTTSLTTLHTASPTTSPRATTMTSEQHRHIHTATERTSFSVKCRGLLQSSLPNSDAGCPGGDSFLLVAMIAAQAGYSRRVNISPASHFVSLPQITGWVRSRYHVGV